MKTEIDLSVLRATIDKAVSDEVAKALADARGNIVNQEYMATIREVARVAVSRRRDDITKHVDEWLNANTDRLVEASARQMIDEALGAIKRRVLGRS